MNWVEKSTRWSCSLCKHNDEWFNFKCKTLRNVREFKLSLFFSSSSQSDMDADEELKIVQTIKIKRKR